MLVGLWGAKGGVGTSVVSAALAHVVSSSSTPTLVLDLGGDQAALLGLAGVPEAGLAELIGAGGDAGDGVIDRLASEVTPNMKLLVRGERDLPSDLDVRAVVGPALAGSSVVADLGSRSDDELARAVFDLADVRMLVVRSCYLALRRAVFDLDSDRADGIILVEEPGRSIGVRDVEHVLDSKVVARVPVRSAIARAVDAGVLAARPPEALVRALDGAVQLVRDSIARSRTGD